MVKQLPGFFFNEEKGKYFPNHMKSIYDNEKRQKIKAQKLTVDYQNQNLSNSHSHMDRFMITNRIRPDFILQKLQRCRVHEIIWPNHIQILENDQKYFRNSWFSGVYTFELMGLEIETGIHRILNSFTDRPENNVRISKFGLFPNKKDDSKLFYITYEFSDSADNTQSSNKFPVLKVFQIVDSVHVNHLEIEYRLRIDLDNPIALNDTGFIYESGENTYNNIYSSKPLRFIQVNFTNILSDRKEILKTFHEVTCFEHFSIGLVVACTGGKLFFQAENIDETVSIQLKVKSAVKWMHYYEDMLLMFTFHGEFVLINLETTNQQILFKLSDLPLYSPNNFKFEDFKIIATGKIILLGYQNGTEIEAYNFMEMSLGPIKKFSFKKKIEQFKISSDCLNLYIRHSS